MEKIYTATATVTGGRNGHVTSADGVIDMDMKSPKEMGGEAGYANPELLFASGWAACFNSALMLVARRKRLNADDAEVTVSVSIGRDIDGATYKLEAEIEGLFHGMSDEEAEKLMHEAHEVCPYSKATRGNVDVTLVSSVA